MIHKGASQARGRRLVANARDATDPEVTRGKFGRSRTRLPRCRSRDERFAEANCGLRHVEAGSGRERSTKKGGWSRRGRRESIGLALSLSAALLRTEARAETEVTGEAGQEQKQVQQQGSPASPPPPSPPPSDSVAGLEAKVEVTSPTDKADAPAPTSSVNPSAITSEATAPPPSAESPPAVTAEGVDPVPGATASPEKGKDPDKSIFSVRKSRVRELQELRSTLKEKEFALMQKQQELEEKEQTMIVMKEQLGLEKKIRDILIEEKEKAIEEAKLAAGLCSQGGMMP